MTGKQILKAKPKSKLLVGKNFIYERRDESARANGFFGHDIKVAPTPISKMRNSDIDDFILYCNQHSTVNEHNRHPSIREEIV